jgi:hypothetical protein
MLLGHGMKRFRKLSRHSRKNFQNSPFREDLILARFSFYTLTRMLLVLVLFLANLMKKAKIMLSPTHLETTRLTTTTLHTKGNVLLLLYGSSTTYNSKCKKIYIYRKKNHACNFGLDLA